MAKRRGHNDAAPYWSEPHQMWRAQIDVGYKNGKRQRKTVYGSTKVKCQQKLNEARRAKEAGDLTTSSMRVDAWLRYWLDNIAAAEVKPRTLADYRSKVNGHLIPALGRHRLHQLAPQHVRELHGTMLDGGSSTTTIAHVHYLLTGALDAAMREVGLGRNVARNVKAPGVAKNKRGALSASQAITLLRAAQDDRMASRWMFALLTGARQGECLGLRWSHLDLDAGLADLAWSLQPVPYRHGCVPRGQDPTCGRKRGDGCPRRLLDIRPDLEHEVLDGNLCLLRPKTTASIREVDLVAPLVSALRLHLTADTSPNPHGLVWRREDGRPIDGRRQDYLAWQDLLKRAGLPKMTLHEARHSTVSLLVELGVDPRTIATIVGHSSLLSQRAYTHVDHRLTRAALEQLGTLLELS